MKNYKPTILSGVAPSGRLTLGNYLGAIRNWVSLQQRFDCYFPLVDLHAITVHQDVGTFAERCLDFIALYIACGVDPVENTIFVQSHVPAHSELAWILQCHTQMGELNRMTQFKQKSRRHNENINAGLFNYPVLMAADILVYAATHVPVGEDQKQHLELTRDIAQRFNGVYGDVFTIPSPLIPDVGARIMSLQDPLKKMSKSDISDNNVIALLDAPDAIVRKIKRSVTDSGNEILNREGKPGIANLLTILSSIQGDSINSLEDQYKGSGYGELKADVAESVVTLLEPIQHRYHEIRSDREGLRDILSSGAEKARTKAQSTLNRVRDALGLIPMVN